MVSPSSQPPACETQKESLLVQQLLRLRYMLYRMEFTGIFLDSVA
jgi:hypothetical protein